jgi:hypothetical protein
LRQPSTNLATEFVLIIRHLKLVDCSEYPK